MGAAAAVRRRSSHVRDEQQSTFSLIAQLSPAAKWLGGTIIFLGAVSVAWNQLDLWKPASVSYVDGKAATLSHKIDQVGTSTLQNRVETLTAAKARDQGEESDLQMKLQLASAQKGTPPDYIQMLKSRLQSLADQSTSLTNQINGIQQTITAKNAEAAK